MEKEYAQIYQDGLDSLSNESFNAFEASFQDQSDDTIKRIMGHLTIKSMMAQNDYKKAITYLKKTKGSYGENIMLIGDLAVLYYLTAQYSLWNETLAEFEAAFHNQKKNLSKKTYERCALLLGKFYEEQGAISKAYSFLLLVEKAEDINLRLRIQANLLRLDVFYSSSKNMFYYSNIKQSIQSDLGFNTSPEIVHAVTLAELEMLEIEQFEKNILKVYESDLLDEDKSLIIFDSVLLMTIKSVAIPASILKLLKKLPLSLPFEQKLKDHFFNSKKFSSGWDQWPSEMPLGNFFQLSRLLIKDLTANEKIAFNKQLLLLTKQLPASDQIYWRKLSTVESNATMELDQLKRIVKIENVEISLKDKKILFDLLNLLIGKSTLSLEEITTKLFNCEFNESYYHRIRRLAKRINDEFESKLLPAPLKCEKESLILSSKYSI